MKIGFISDVHGNVESLSKCLNFFRSNSIDQIYFLGDAVGYLPDCLEVLRTLKANNIQCIKGNHEAMMLGEMPISNKNKSIYNLDASLNSMSKEDLDFVQGWKSKIELIINNKRVLLVHGSPDNHLGGYVYMDSDFDEFNGLPYDIIIMGHTHRPFIRETNQKTFVNVGSIGLPRDIGNLASFAIFDPSLGNFTIYRYSFQVEKYLSDKNVHQVVKECLKRKSKEVVGLKIEI